MALERALPAPRAVLIGGVLTAALGLFVKPVADADFWLHSRTGRWIVEHRALPAHDLFTYTVADHRWVNHEYLTEVLMWLVQARLGLAGVSVALGALAWFGLVLVAAACGPRHRPYAIVGAAVALGAVAGAPVWGPRPQMVTFVLAALELLWLRRALDDERSRAILWLPLLMALWSSLHGGWPAGFLFLGLALAAEAVGWAMGGRPPRRAAVVRRLALAGALSAVAVGLNPNGPAIYAYPFQTVASAAQQSLIREWMSPDFHLASLRAFELMALALGAGLALGRARAFDVLVALAGLALALESVRHIALFVAAATPVLAITWSDAWTRHVAARLPARRVAPARWGPALGAATLLGVAAVIGPRIAGELARQPELTARVVPVGAADWLAAHPGTGTRLFNEYAWGGYLADRFYPDPSRRVYVLSEGTLMGDAQLFRYRDVATLRPGWRAVLAEDRVDCVVFDSGSALDGALAHDPGWRLAYRDATAVVYVRVGS